MGSISRFELSEWNSGVMIRRLVVLAPRDKAHEVFRAMIEAGEKEVSTVIEKVPEGL